MRIVRTFHEVPPPLQGGVLALGNFDGLHLGQHPIAHRGVFVVSQHGQLADLEFM